MQSSDFRFRYEAVFDHLLTLMYSYSADDKKRLKDVTSNVIVAPPSSQSTELGKPLTAAKRRGDLADPIPSTSSVSGSPLAAGTQSVDANSPISPLEHCTPPETPLVNCCHLRLMRRQAWFLC